MIVNSYCAGTTAAALYNTVTICGYMFMNKCAHTVHVTV